MTGKPSFLGQSWSTRVPRINTETTPKILDNRSSIHDVCEGHLPYPLVLRRPDNSHMVYNMETPVSNVVVPGI